ncbi:MAG TPA: RsmB/NOP family class I SAM-dependent RNA methyltransferase [Thermoplasmata archaeon]|nr:RsmB/NOP family class I SAM-dependent RNA methyltransferase [Thermoplasmata archaeon]
MKDDVPLDLGRALTLCSRALHSNLAKQRPLASALRDALSGSRDAPATREAAALLAHSAIARKSVLTMLLRAEDPEEVPDGWVPLRLTAAAMRWGPSVRGLRGMEEKSFPILAKIAADVGLSDAERWLSFLRDGPHEPLIFASIPADEPGRLGFRASFPAWIVSRISGSFGVAGARNVISYLNEPAPVYLRVARSGEDAKTIAALSAEDVQVRPTGRVEGALEVVRGDPRGSRPLEQGGIEIQDEASQLVARLAAPAGGGRVLDFCAGSGGKSLAMASIPDVYVTVHDADPARLETLAKRTARSGVAIRRMGEGRLPGGPMHPGPSGDQGYDSVLVDASCSGLGAARRNPEARWSILEEEAVRFTSTQLSILEEAAPSVRAGGILVYSVCTFLREETEAVVDRFLASRSGFAEAPAPGWAVPHLTKTPHGYLTWPSLWGADIFFVSILRRNEGGGEAAELVHHVGGAPPVERIL